jgi:two-component system, NtrC family, response regulator AtoC
MAIHGSILVADDDEKIVRALGDALREEGHEVIGTTSARQARELLRERLFDLLVLDNIMPEMTGLELLQDLVNATPAAERPQILMMSGQGTIEGAVEAMRLGAIDYLRKPFEIDHLLETAARALEAQQTRLRARPVAMERDEEFNSYGMVGRSRAVQELARQARLVAATKSTVLITGETGTGKELLARGIHADSPRRARPLVKVNCAAIPDHLLESELFGYVRGAFTGAMTSKRGKFTMADGGSIFLDEIGTLSLCLQPKILRVLQERELEPLGAERSERVDVRVIAATNRDLGRMVGDGRFLEDLYYRLNVIPLHIPPLRERPEDIPVLVRHFIQKHQRQAGKQIEGIDEAAMQVLMRYNWPGNVRELENTIERATVLTAGSVLTAQCVSVASAGPADAAALPSMLLRNNVDWVERETVKRALGVTHGIKKDAADLIGVSQRALSYYLSKHRIQ